MLDLLILQIATQKEQRKQDNKIDANSSYQTLCFRRILMITKKLKIYFKCK